MILGDTCDNSAMARQCVGADVLVHEATNENAHEMKCVENGHSTPGTCTYMQAYSSYLHNKLEILHHVYDDCCSPLLLAHRNGCEIR